MPSVLTAGLVVHAPGADRAARQWAAVAGGDGRLDRVLFLLARHERAPAGAVGPGPADLDLGAVQAYGQSFGGGVGQYVSQGEQPYPGRGGEDSIGQQRADLADRGGDGGA